MSILTKIIIPIIVPIITFLLGVFFVPWLKNAINDRRERKRLKVERLRQVVIVYDRNKFAKRRRCFWKDIFEEYRSLRTRNNFRFFSIADTLEKSRGIACEGNADIFGYKCYWRLL